MTNREKYAKEILDIACSGNGVAKIDGKITECGRTNCDECDFFEHGRACDDVLSEWSNSEYVEPPVDWSKVAVDTPILVKDHERTPWCRRYFAEYEDGKVTTWRDGRTSWNAGGYVQKWDYAKLAESEE